MRGVNLLTPFFNDIRSSLAYNVIERLTLTLIFTQF